MSIVEMPSPRKEVSSAPLVVNRAIATSLTSSPVWTVVRPTTTILPLSWIATSLSWVDAPKSRFTSPSPPNVVSSAPLGRNRTTQPE